jgi:hypothetical protein
MRVIHWRGDSAFTSLFVRDKQMLAPLAKDGGGPIFFHGNPTGAPSVCISDGWLTETHRKGQRDAR